MGAHEGSWSCISIRVHVRSIMENNLGMVSQRLRPDGRCQESSASASATGPAAAASATALTHGADVLRQRASPGDAVPATADNEAKPTAAATTAATIAAKTEATTIAHQHQNETVCSLKNHGTVYSFHCRNL